MQELKCPECGYLNPDIRELEYKLPHTCGRCYYSWRLQDVINKPISVLPKPVLWYRDSEDGPVFCSSDHPEALPLYSRPASTKPVAWADKIAFESAMEAGKGCDVWPEPGDYEVRTGRELIGVYTLPAKQESVSRYKINKLMEDAGWQNSYLRWVDLDKVERVVRAIEEGNV